MLLEQVWDEQYDGKSVTALKDSNLFRMETEAIISSVSKEVFARGNSAVRVLELGSGSGELIRRLDEALSSRCPGVRFIGVDFSGKAVDLARSKRSGRQHFEQSDFLSYLKTLSDSSVDLVVTQRSIMALMEEEQQRDLVCEVSRVLTPNGAGVFSECFSTDLSRFNKLRLIAGLPPVDKVWHSRYLDEAIFEDVFGDVAYHHFCSTYMLITRIVYPMFEDPVHNQLIHDVASQMPNSGSTSFLKLAVVRKCLL